MRVARRLAAKMSSDQFLIALGIVAAVGIGGLTLYKNIAGEMCLLLALVAGTVSLMAYMLTWPVTGTGGIVMSQTILVAAILCGVVHYVCAEEREKEREKLWPRIRMKCLNFTLFSDPLNNPHEGLLVIDLHFTNTGKPTALNEWALRCYFTDGSSYGVGSASLRAQDDYQGIRNTF